MNADIDKVLKETEEARNLSDVFDTEFFGNLHLPCGTVRVVSGPFNSAECDPSDSSPIPVFGYRLHCDKHNTSSKINTES